MAKVISINDYRLKYKKRIWATRNNPQKVHDKFAEFLGTSKKAKVNWIRLSYSHCGLLLVFVYIAILTMVSTSFSPLQEELLKQLREIHTILKQISTEYNLYGTSLCIVVEGDLVRVVIIDFVKAEKVADGLEYININTEGGCYNLIEIIQNPALANLQRFYDKSYDDIEILLKEKKWGYQSGKARQWVSFYGQGGFL